MEVVDHLEQADRPHRRVFLFDSTCILSHLQHRPVDGVENAQEIALQGVEARLNRDDISSRLQCRLRIALKMDVRVVVKDQVLVDVLGDEDKTARHGPNGIG